jgi:hypothetical protein
VYHSSIPGIVLPGVARNASNWACAFLFSLMVSSKMKKLQSPIIFLLYLMSLHGSIALSRSYYVYLGPIARNVCVIVVIAWSNYFGL